MIYAATIAAGGSVCIFASAAISLSNIIDTQSFVSIQTEKNIVGSPTPYSMSAIGGSIAINSRISISLSNSNFDSCSATASYNGASNVSLAAIGGAVLFSAAENPFGNVLRSWFTKPIQFTLSFVKFNGNSASAIRVVPTNAATTSIMTVLGGAATILRSDQLIFCNFSNQTCNQPFSLQYQNFDHFVSVSNTVFSSNVVRAAFPNQASTPAMPSTANSVVLGGSLCAARLISLTFASL